MNADNIGVLPDELNNRIVFFDLFFFCDRTFQRLFILHTDMPPKAENFLAHCFLETVSECEGNDHDGNTDRGGHNRKAYNEPGKRSLTVKRDSIGYEACNPQGEFFVF